MPINIGIPRTLPGPLYKLILEILRRAVDGTTSPISFNGTVTITGGDLKIVTAGKGIIIPNRSGTQYYRLIMEDNGAISADPL